MLVPNGHNLESSQGAAAATRSDFAFQLSSTPMSATRGAVFDFQNPPWADPNDSILNDFYKNLQLSTSCYCFVVVGFVLSLGQITEV